MTLFSRLLSQIGFFGQATPSDSHDSADEEMIHHFLPRSSGQNYKNTLPNPQKGTYPFISTILKAEEDIHLESILGALGALAGYACQAGLREKALSEGQTENTLFTIMTGQDGRRYYFGRGINQALVDSPSSVWNIASEAARHAGYRQYPDMNRLFRRAIESVGQQEFGIPDLPPESMPRETPLAYTQKFWSEACAFVRQFTQNPEEWPVIFSISIYETILASRKDIDPGTALKIVMEYAVPMSRIDLTAYR